MKKTSSLLALIVIAFLTNLSISAAEVRELPTMAQAVATADRHTLVIFDLDNTVLEAKQMLGSDQFFGYLMELAKKRGLDENAAKEWSLSKAGYVQPRTGVQAVEAITPALIQSLQKRGIFVMALTARPAGWADSTLKQVASLGVDFRATAPRLISAPMESAGHFVNGVFFLTKKSNKGAAMLEILKQTSTSVNRVLFIDDKTSNIESVEKALAQTSIAHLSIRYSAADAKVANFRADIAQCEWQEYFAGHGFITDAQAAGALRQGLCHSANGFTR
jgi:hypothetical protein